MCVCVSVCVSVCLCVCVYSVYRLQCWRHHAYMIHLVSLKRCVSVNTMENTGISPNFPA